MKAQMKVADRSGAPLAAIIGEDEVASGEVGRLRLRGDTGQERIALAHSSLLQQRLSNPSPSATRNH